MKLLLIINISVSNFNSPSNIQLIICTTLEWLPTSTEDNSSKN